MLTGSRPPAAKPALADAAATDFTVTGTREALLRTVLEYPFDDLPVRILTDWLEENGQDLSASLMRYKAAEFAGLKLDDLDTLRVATLRVALTRAVPVVRHFEADTAAFLAHAPALFAHQPVTSVRLTDKRAWNDRLIPGLHYWYAGGPNAAGLPATVFMRLAEARNERASYPTQAAADAALSRALVDHGRELAGLRPIDWDTEGHS